MKLNRIATVAAAGALLAGGTGAAVAATSSDDPKQREQAVLDDAAGRLGTTPQELRDALGAALDAQLDKAVADGTLTQEQADEMKQRRQESGGVLGFPGGPGGPGLLGPGRPGGVGHFDDVADALGITEQQLFDRVRAGRTVAQIAKAQGKSLAEVKRDVRAATRTRLDKAVADGELTESQADDMLEHLDEHLDRLDSIRGLRGGPGPHEGPPPAPPGPYLERP